MMKKNILTRFIQFLWKKTNEQQSIIVFSLTNGQTIIGMYISEDSNTILIKDAISLDSYGAAISTGLTKPCLFIESDYLTLYKNSISWMADPLPEMELYYCKVKKQLAQFDETVKSSILRMMVVSDVQQNPEIAYNTILENYDVSDGVPN